MPCFDSSCGGLAHFARKIVCFSYDECSLPSLASLNNLNFWNPFGIQQETPESQKWENTTMWLLTLGRGGGGGAIGWKREVGLNLLIEQTNFAFHNVKIQLHTPKIARGMDSLKRIYFPFTALKS